MVGCAGFRCLLRFQSVRLQLRGEHRPSSMRRITVKSVADVGMSAVATDQEKYGGQPSRHRSIDTYAWWPEGFPLLLLVPRVV
jgi:hypothetical protein